MNRIAHNINFSYEMKYNQRISKKAADEQFEVGRISEFVDSPFDYEVGDVSVVSNFIGAKYAKEAIRKKNNLYRKLVALEHRRWNAYIIMRGFRAPTVQEEATLLYHDGNSHQDKKRLLHICLCDCSEKVSLENDFDRLYHEWIQKKCPRDFPSELDRASLRVHQLAAQLSEKIDINQVMKSIHGDCTIYNNFRFAIMKQIILLCCTRRRWMLPEHMRNLSLKKRWK